MNDIKLYPIFHSIDTDKKYCIVLGGRGSGKTYIQEQYLRSHYPLSFLKDFYKVSNSDLRKVMINRIYGKEGTGEMKRYKISYRTPNGDGCWYEVINDNNGKGHTEQEIFDALTKGFFNSGKWYADIHIKEIIQNSELFEELFFIQYRVFGKQEIEVDFFTTFRDFCYHIVKISTDLGDILNADKITAAQRGICGGFFQNVKYNKKFNSLYKIVEVDGKKYFRGLKG